jgi:hypothetical protein
VLDIPGVDKHTAGSWRSDMVQKNCWQKKHFGWFSGANGLLASMIISDFSEAMSFNKKKPITRITYKLKKSLWITLINITYRID